MIRLVLFLVLLMVFRLPAFSQIRQAEKEMAVYNFSEAVVLLQKALTRGAKDEEPKVVGLLAECYRMLNNWQEAKTYYRRAIGLGAATPENYYYLAHAYRVSGDYEEAKRLFLQSSSLAPGKLNGNHFAATCDSAIQWMNEKPSFAIRNMEMLNSPQSEFGAVMLPSGLLFTSDRIPDKGKEDLYGWTGNSYLRLFLAMKSPDQDPAAFLSPGEWNELSGQHWHNGPATFNKEFTEAFLNRTLGYGDRAKKEAERTRTHLLKIYSAEKRSGKWTKLLPFFLNDRNWSVGHPALSPDGNTLFFVSDQPGGFGGTDIYQCNRTQQGWSAPVNLGPVVNTPGNEMFPFCPAEDELWFASDYHPGFGGLDIFTTKRANGQWSSPVNAGHPLNSSYDDFSVWADSIGNSGFFSSNRPGGVGEDDIYYFEKSAVGSRQLAENDTTAPRHHGTKVDSGQWAVGSLEINKPYILENIYYDFDKWDIREDAKPALDSLVRIMEQYPVTIELGSHTDCRGTGEYNRDLSQRRAESAVTYIIDQGIDASRIMAKGYGETMPVNRCNCESGITCSEAEHQANRRTEFKILSLEN